MDMVEAIKDKFFKTYGSYSSDISWKIKTHINENGLMITNAIKV